MKPAKTQKQRTFAPEGAPLRPALSSVSSYILLSLLFAYLTAVLIKEVLNATVALLVVVPLFGWVCWHIFALWREFNRTSWYEQRPISVPDLPFRGIINSNPIVFEESYVALPRKKTVFYRDIVRVKVLCEGVSFSGLQLTLTNGKTERIGNYDKDGEPARTALAILRQKTSQATFTGPSWIEQGWVPRLGFSHPGTGS